MVGEPVGPDPTVTTGAGGGPALAERLERNELVVFPVCPFPLPEGDDYRFLLEQRQSHIGHKNISYDPRTGKTTGFVFQSRAQAERLRDIMGMFSRTVSGWLATVLPVYAGAWCLDRASWRAEEEATRQLRLTARNDLLHVDTFPTRPTQGRRILRCFVNINPIEPRTWVTTEPFPRLLERYGPELGLPSALTVGPLTWLRESFAQMILPGRAPQSDYDLFMLRFHNFLKGNDAFQEHCPKRYWSFPPRSAWLAFTDAVCYGELRGRYALEHSYFVPTHVLLMPAAAPVACLQRASGRTVLPRAA